ncbi:MBL fold metallo-hydrolase [Bacteroides fluxus]|uniref:MBL fold metallo-hydrolase n=1 Tax=Bacteroides fluxus TaxID=626930 RepID=UPI0023A8AAA0|nr:MBL fold metallo-hydrolase [Bacteroides fluxus]
MDKVEKVEIVRIVNSVFQSNTYLIINSNYRICFLIDCGDSSLIIDTINKRGLFLKGVFITHSHFDHIYGLNAVISEYPGILIYISAFGKEGLYSDKLNLSRYNLCPYVLQRYDNIKELNEGDTIDLFGNIKIEAYETPGHDKSCLTYKFGNYLFTGDAFIPGLKVVATFPNSNKMDAELSRQRIIFLSKKCGLYPGHGEIYENFQSEVYL